ADQTGPSPPPTEICTFTVGSGNDRTYTSSAPDSLVTMEAQRPSGEKRGAMSVALDALNGRGFGAVSICTLNTSQPFSTSDCSSSQWLSGLMSASGERPGRSISASGADAASTDWLQIAARDVLPPAEYTMRVPSWVHSAD